MKPNLIEELEQNCDYVAGLLKTMAHPKRLMILCHLTQGRKSVTELEQLSGISQSQVSQFLKRMQYENLVEFEKEGNFIYYAIKDKRVLDLISKMHGIFCKRK
jgi:DNA-binding transcriptional ArsR family regulator